MVTAADSEKLSLPKRTKKFFIDAEVNFIFFRYGEPQSSPAAAFLATIDVALRNYRAGWWTREFDSEISFFIWMALREFERANNRIQYRPR